jgi:hypothetical protein
MLGTARALRFQGFSCDLLYPLPLPPAHLHPAWCCCTVAPSDAVSQADDSAAGTEDLGQALPATNFTSFKSHVTEGGASTTASNTSNPGRRPFGRSDSRMSRVAMSGRCRGTECCLTRVWCRRVACLTASC